MRAFRLYIRYALRSFQRGRTRSVFGALCVAVGVGSVVALGLVGGNLQSALSGDAQKQNRGDLSVVPPGSGFSRAQYRVFADLKQHGEIVDYTGRLQDGSVLADPRAYGSSTLGNFAAVDPSKFPFYDTIKADQPAGVPLARLLAKPNGAVVSHDVTASLRVGLGDRIAVDSGRGFTHLYTVTGVVPDGAWNPGFSTFTNNDFILVSSASALPFFRGLDTYANTVYVKTREQAQAERVKAELQQRLGDLATIKTVADVRKESDGTAGSIDRFFRIMGLVAVLVGGIGIVNTMLVAARRRTREIAVLKSLGMKGRQVVLVFGLEALMLALAGTVVGLALGIVASLAVNSVTQGMAGFTIPWTVHRDAVVAGILMGLAATMVFASLPVVEASEARPIAALRSEVTGFPNQRRVRNGLLVLGLAAVAGYLGVLYTGLFSGADAVLYGVAAGIGALLAAAFLTQLFLLLIWLISALPSMGRLSFRLAFRSMSSQKRRLSSTLLAICVGILAVGSSAILAQNLKASYAAAIESQLKINVAVQIKHDPAGLNRLQRVVATLPGVERQDHGAVADNIALWTVNGQDAGALMRHNLLTHGATKNDISQAMNELRGIEGRDLRIGGYHLALTGGRNLDRRDVGTDSIVVSDDVSKTAGITVGSHLIFREGSRRVPFTVVGIDDLNSPDSFRVFAHNQADLSYMQRMGLTSPSPSRFSTLYLQIRKDLVQSDIATMRRALPGVLILDLSKFLPIFNKVIDKLVVFPEVVAALSLFAGAVIIANTVALAMLERRREIGVMKAVGATRRTILQFLLTENAIVGFLGALVGVGLAVSATVVVDAQYLHIGASIDWLTVAGLLLLGAALAVGASALTALPASGERPMIVLRYE